MRFLANLWLVTPIRHWHLGQALHRHVQFTGLAWARPQVQSPGGNTKHQVLHLALRVIELPAGVQAVHVLSADPSHGMAIHKGADHTQRRWG